MLFKNLSCKKVEKHRKVDCCSLPEGGMNKRRILFNTRISMVDRKGKERGACNWKIRKSSNHGNSERKSKRIPGED